MLALLVACLIITFGISHGDPTPAVQWLMREPYTLLDRAMDRLETKLGNDMTPEGSLMQPQWSQIEPLLFPLKLSGGNARYSMKANKIFLAIHASLDGGTAAQAKDACGYIIKQTKAIFGSLKPDGTCGLCESIDEPSTLSFFFSHSYSQLPVSLANELDRITEVHAYVATDGYHPGMHSVSCQSKFREPEIYYLDDADFSRWLLQF